MCRKEIENGLMFHVVVVIVLLKTFQNGKNFKRRPLEGKQGAI